MNRILRELEIKRATLNLKLKSKIIKVFIVFCIVFLLDITMKLYVGLNYIVNLSLLFFELHFSINTRIADINIAILVLSLLLISFVCFKYVDKNIGLSFIFVGCMINFIDYLIWGFVIDFLKIGNIVFNFSDVSIIFGILLSIVIYFKFLIKRFLH